MRHPISAGERLLGIGSDRQTHAQERRGDAERGRGWPDQGGAADALALKLLEEGSDLHSRLPSKGGSGMLRLYVRKGSGGK